MPDEADVDRDREDRTRDLLASAAFFKGVFDIAVDAIISMDESQRIILFNQGAERIFQYRADEVLGQPLAMLLPEDARHQHHHQVDRFGDSPTVARQMGERGSIWGRRKNGVVFPAEASISHVKIEGRLVFTAILRDVTAARQAERAIRELNGDLEHRAAQLEHANRELEAFSYSVSHDLRAPLRTITGFSQILIEDFADQLDAEGADYLRRIVDAGGRMAQLIDDLLNLSRVSRQPVRTSPVDLTAMAHAVADELGRADPTRSVRFTVADGLSAVADAQLLRAAMYNLLGNAWKYTTKQSRAVVEFGARPDDGGRTVFFVRDNGAGFDMAYADKLFGPFQRLHATAEYPGTGIGLATVQRIIHKHGGEIWADAAVGQGATFYFTLE